MSRRWLVLLLPLAMPLPGQEPADPPPAAEARALPVFEPGAHTEPIVALGFSGDGKRLVTVGHDETIQVWDAASGERLDLLRLPGYGSARAMVRCATVSPDGTRVALGGTPRPLSPDGKEKTHLLVVDLPTRAVRSVTLPAPFAAAFALAFTPDGKRLVAGGSAPKRVHAVVSNLDRLMKDTAAPPRAGDMRIVGPGDELKANWPTALAFAPDGARLLTGQHGDDVLQWELAGAKLKVAGRVKATHPTSALCWSPDGKQFLRAFRASRGPEGGLELWNADGSVARQWTFKDLAPAFAEPAHSKIHAIRYLGVNRVLLTGETVGFGPAAGFGALKTGFGAVSAVLDLASGKCERHFAEGAFGQAYPQSAVSLDGRLVATTVALGAEVVITRLADGTVVARCGPRTPVPTHVGWAADPKQPGFAWGESPRSGCLDTTPDDLRFAFDLTRLEPVRVGKPADYATGKQKLGDWSLVIDSQFGQGLLTRLRLFRGDKLFKVWGATERFTAATIVPQGDKPPLVARAGLTTLTGAHLMVASDEEVVHWRPNFTYVRDLAASPDGRYVVVATGAHRVAVFDTRGRLDPLFYFAAVNGEWALWTPEGYYAASPGGEKLFGWAVQAGPNKLVEFHPAAAFAKTFRRPDVLKLALELGSVDLALKKLEAKPADVEEVLPPTATLQLVDQQGAKVRVKARAVAAPKGKPVVALRLMLDGRPLGNGRGTLEVAPGKPAEAAWEVDIPGGGHELRLLARSADGLAVSDPVKVRGPKDPASQPTLHRVCIGVDDYDQSALKLTSAAKDAKDVFAALEQHCVGPENRFGAAPGTLLLNKDATRAAALAALAEAKKKAKPGDLLLVFFAGHGVRQGEEYYLLTREADTTALKEKSLSGEDLRQALADVECPVLLLLDACHSARAVKSLKPATEAATRELTSDAIGVTVLAAAMAHEVADADRENGYFTAGLLKALRGGDGVPFDPYDRSVYVHHVYSVIYSEVRQASNGKQNPFLNMPTTMPPVTLREVPAR